eukprot:11567796-Alexandrium_andersonii.AAC.1
MAQWSAHPLESFRSRFETGLRSDKRYLGSTERCVRSAERQMRSECKHLRSRIRCSAMSMSCGRFEDAAVS